MAPRLALVVYSVYLAVNSDVEKRLVLTQVPSSRLRNARVAAAYRRVADAMRSGSERQMVMRRLAGNR